MELIALLPHRRNVSPRLAPPPCRRHVSGRRARVLCSFLLGALLGLPFATLLSAQEENGSEVMEVIGVSPIQGGELPETYLPFHVQRVNAEDLEIGHGLDITDYLNRRFSGVSISEVQSNRYQPDVQFRGFTASPLLGAPQGLAVYQDAVRVNEVFGDTLNWDLIPEGAIATLNLVSGANPVFGLNALGGALSIVTKNGFDYPGHSVEMQGGSNSQLSTQLESAGHGELWAYYVHLNYLDEDSWRALTSTGMKNSFGKLSFRDEEGRTDLDLSFAYADNELTGNGPAPVELLEQSRQQIFTAPDITDNELRYANMQFEHLANDLVSFSGNAYYRESLTDSFNGDVSDFEACTADDTLLCREENRVETELRDQNDESLSSTLNAINNISQREQQAYGGSLQSTLFFGGSLFDAQVVVGGAYQHGSVDFRSQVEAAVLGESRLTTRTGRYLPQEGVGLNIVDRTWSVYFSETTSFDWLHVTLSGRFNNTRIRLRDVGGGADPLSISRPSLNGTHEYQRFNPAVGFSIEATPDISIYGGYSESSRAPTAVELACADEMEPCRLPNAFLSDPPLEQVVAKGFDVGIRGRYADLMDWHFGAYRIINKDDILFQATGGASSNQGFFRNVGSTRRLGLEASLGLSWRAFDLSLGYGFVEATFEDAFESFSPNHPAAVGGRIQVAGGDRVPGIPRHTGKAALDWQPHEQLLLGLDFIFNSDQILRGDESNQVDPVGSYGILNFYGEVRAPEALALDLSFHVRVDNVLAREYENFGLLGDPSEVFASYSDPRFLSPGAPRAIFAGVSLSF